MSGPGDPAPPTFAFTVTRAAHGVRADTFLHRHLRNHSPARLSRAALTGAVTLADGAPVGPAGGSRRATRSSSAPATRRTGPRTRTPPR